MYKEMKIDKYGVCHMTKMADKPIYVKNPLNLILWNQGTDFNKL